jgi:hypothetical protein
VPAEREDFLPGAGVPQDHLAGVIGVAAGRGEARAVGVEGEAADELRVPSGVWRTPPRGVLHQQLGDPRLVRNAVGQRSEQRRG